MKRMSRALLVFLSVLFALPIFLMIWLSITIPEKGMVVGLLSQYQRVFADERFVDGLLNASIITGLSVVLHFPIALMLGLLISRNGRSIPMLRRLLVLVLLIPFQLIMMPTYKMSVTIGLYDTQWDVILLAAFSPLGIIAISMLIEGVPMSMVEAAYIETSSQWHVVTRVILPYIAPGIMMIGVIVFADIWNMTEQPLILIPTTEKQPISLILNDAVQGGARMTYSYAGSVIYASPVILLYCVLVRQMRKHLK